MGIETILAAGGLLMSAVGGVSGMMQANQQSAYAQQVAAQQQTILKENFANQTTASNDQERQALENATRAKSDREARAAQQFATLRVLAGEMGTSGGTFNALVQQGAYAEGTDLSRVDTTYEHQWNALEFGKKQAQIGAQAQAVSINNDLFTSESRASAAFSNAIIGSLGSALQIGGKYYQNQAQLTKAMNPNG